MKVKINDQLAWYFKNGDVTPRFQHVNICSAEIEIDVEPNFTLGDQYDRDIQSYVNAIKSHIQSIDARMREDKVFFNRYLLHNTDDPQPLQAGAKGPNSEGTQQNAQTSIPPMQGKSAPAPATSSDPLPPEGGEEITDKQIKYISYLMNDAIKNKRWDVTDFVEKYLDLKKYKSTHNMTKKEGKEVIDKLLHMTGKAKDGQ